MGLIGDVIKSKVIGSEIRKGIKEIKEENKSEVKMKCPKCKEGILIQETYIKENAPKFRSMINRLKSPKKNKIIITLCPLCDFKKERIIF